MYDAAGLWSSLELTALVVAWVVALLVNQAFLFAAFRENLARERARSERAMAQARRAYDQSLGQLEARLERMERDALPEDPGTQHAAAERRPAPARPDDDATSPGPFPVPARSAPRGQGIAGAPRRTPHDEGAAPTRKRKMSSPSASMPALPHARKCPAAAGKDRALPFCILPFQVVPEEFARANPVALSAGRPKGARPMPPGSKHGSSSKRSKPVSSGNLFYAHVVEKMWREKVERDKSLRGGL